MKLSYNQIYVLMYLASVESATKKDIFEHSNISYYHNTNKYHGDILKRMVDRKLIERVERGRYRIIGKKNVDIDFGLFEGGK